MKKKFAAMAIAFGVLSTVFAVSCGKTEQSSTNSSADNSASSQQETFAEDSVNNEDFIMLEPEYVVVDNEDLKLAITSISRRKFGEEYEYLLSYAVENRSREYSVGVYASLGELYIGSHQVNFAISGDKTLPQKVSDNEEIVALTDTEGIEYINELSDLFMFNGYITVELIEQTEASNVRHSCDRIGVSLEGYQFSKDGKGYSFEDSLQGKWELKTDTAVTTFSYNKGTFNGEATNAAPISGTYTIDCNLKEVKMEYGIDGEIHTMAIPFKLTENGIEIYNPKTNMLWDKISSN